jgi:RNA-directed DNA polymerase
MRRSPLRGSELGEAKSERGSEYISDSVVGAGSLSALIVLLTSGNAAPGGPGRGKRGTVVNRVVSEKHEGALKPASVSTKQERIAELARNNPARALTSLNHYLDAEWMQYAYECTRKDGAVGVDGQTGEGYALNLECNLADLLDRLKSGRYRAPPVRRHYLEKPGGSERAIGIPTFEDKVAQRAIVMLLEPIYEQDFMDCSFGYRVNRNAHQALQVLHKGVMAQRGHWVVEVDVRKYFDSIPRAELRAILARRVADGVVRRLIDKWLKAGVLENGQVHYPEAGTPQGGTISPILSNVFLHHVIDEWFSREVQPRLRGPSTLVRFCDDFVMLFAHKADAERVLAVLGKRLGRFGLQLHPDKTRLVDFRPVRGSAEGAEETLPTTFVFLGFLHAWGVSRKGNKVVRQFTAKERLARSLKRFNQQCREMMHWPLNVQHDRLGQMLKGHYAYFGITGNFQRLKRLHRMVTRLWRKWLSRRSWKSHLNWQRFARVLERFALPVPRIVHPYTSL